MPKFRLKGQQQYQAWAESWHSGRVLRKLARQTPQGRNHLIAGAIVMTAFSIEAFCQTLGPEAYGLDVWCQGKRPAERDSIKNKLKTIGKHFGQPVDYGKAPWLEVAELIEARDKMAHPKDAPWTIDDVVSASTSDEVSELAPTLLRAKYMPLLDIDRLDAAAEAIEKSLLSIWVASGRNDTDLQIWAGGLWSITLAK